MPDYRNPFIVGSPVPPGLFIGRRREVEVILDRLVSPAPVSIAISGERRIGRTSLLHYIYGGRVAQRWGLRPEEFTFVLIDSYTIVPFTPDSFWRHILRSLVQQIYKPDRHFESLLDTLLDKGKKIESFELNTLFDHIAQEGKLAVLLLDTFEHVVEHVDPDNPELLYLLRALINRPIRGLALVLASREPLNALLRDFRFSGSPFPTGFASLSLDSFSRPEAAELMDVYTHGTDVRFTEQDREFAYEISKGHPYWLQKTCFKLFQRRMENMTWRKTVDETDLSEIDKGIAEEMQAEREARATSEERKDERENYQIFLCYAREDEGKVKKLYQELSDAGFKPWMDTEDIHGGQRWQSIIRQAIRRSDFFLVCLSANSVRKRGMVQREMKQALDLWQEKLEDDIYLIPVRLDDCEVPESLREFQ